MRITKEKLHEFNACAPGYKWFLEQYPKGKANLKELVERIISAKRHNDGNWLLSHVMTRKQRMAYAIFAAEQVIHIYEKQHPNDPRPRNVIEAAKAVLKRDTKENQEKLDAAWAAARDAAWDAAWVAAWAAARAATRDAAWAAARDAAWAAARDAAWAAARDAARAAARAAAWDAAWAAAWAAMMEKILRYGISLIK